MLVGVTATPEAIAALRCPVCHGPLVLDGRVLGCPNGHRFDLARQGYATLAAGAIRHPGDTPTMLDARTVVQDAGMQAAITRGLVEAVPADARLVVDLGAGTGHHLAAVVDGAPDRHGIAIDSAKAAGKRAARAHDRVFAVVADVTAELPLGEGVADVVTCVFAPRNGAEIARVLRSGGRLVVITPTPDHLAELVEPLGLLTVDVDKAERLEAGLPDLRLLGRESVRDTVTVDHPLARAIVGMGPNAFHLSPDDIADRVAGLPDPLAVTIAVEVTTFTP